MNSLVQLLSSRVKAEVFRLLFGLSGERLHVREIARRARLNDATVRQELKRLGSLGLVASIRDGNRTYFRANFDHPLYPEIRNLVLKTSGLADVLRKSLEGLDIDAAFVFGSIAAQTQTPSSDVDLMILGKVSLRRVAPFLAQAAPTLGREINPHLLTSQDLVRRRNAKDHFVMTVLAGPKLFVIGNERDLEGLGG